MYHTKTSSPIKNSQKINEFFNESEIFDISLQEISSGSSKKCSDSDCSLCELERLHQNLNWTNIDEEKKIKNYSLVSFINKSSSSGSTDSKNNSFKLFNPGQEDTTTKNNINNPYKNHYNFKRPFCLEKTYEILENDISFWNLYQLAFNPNFQNIPKNDSEYHKLAEKYALNN